MAAATRRARLPRRHPFRRPPPSPSLQVLPASYDFGKVTSTNSSAPLEVTIKNNGNAALNVSGISFNAPADPSFLLNPGLGTKPCASVSPTVAAGDSCTVQVSFQPSANGSFTSTLRITSNDPTSPSFGLPIQGARENVTSLLVRINQLDTGGCANNSVKAYVSVTDQGGFPVLGPDTVQFLGHTDAHRSTSTHCYLRRRQHADRYFGSVGSQRQRNQRACRVCRHENRLQQLLCVVESGRRGRDHQVQWKSCKPCSRSPWTSCSCRPPSRHRTPTLPVQSSMTPSIRPSTKPRPQTNQPRKAVIVATDGVDEGLPATTPCSTHTVAQVIANGVDKKVPVFTIGLGASINATVLQQIASGTGGLYYQSSTSQNLATIYQQLSSLLYANQYVLTFNQLSKGNAVSFQISSSARTWAACPPEAIRERSRRVTEVRPD